ncbi:hypothetical protein ACR03S_04575 [Limimaricola variabilis]
MAKFEVGSSILARIHNERNLTKGECYFVGFLEGVLANKRIDNTEVEPLLETCQAFCENFDDDDAREVLIEAAQDYVDTVSELLQLIDCIVECRLQKIDATCPKSSANRLLGFCAGVACDGVITVNEVRSLLKRLSAPSDLQEDLRVAALKRVCLEALEDGLIDDDEEREIADWIARLVGDSYSDTGLTTFGSSPVLDDSAEFKLSEMRRGEIFVLTGNFEICSRADFAETLTAMGLNQARSVSKKVSYVVVGSEAARDWRLASMGTKMQRAFQLKGQGHPIKIVSESSFRRLFEGVGA